jgi:hypothetical protein
MKSANDYNMSMVQVAHLDGIRLVARRSMSYGNASSARIGT